MANLNKNDIDAINDIIKNGGTHTVTVVATDIDSTGSTEFENYEGIKDKLYDGFTIPPTTVIHDAEHAATLIRHGDLWTKYVVLIHRAGGKIIYKKVAHKTYEATIIVPTP